MEECIYVRTTWKSEFIAGLHGRLYSCEDHMEDCVTVHHHFLGPHGRLYSCEDRMENYSSEWIHMRTTWKNVFM